MGGNTRFISSVEHDILRSGRSERVGNIVMNIRIRSGVSKDSCISFVYYIKKSFLAM